MGVGVGILVIALLGFIASYAKVIYRFVIERLKLTKSIEKLQGPRGIPFFGNSLQFKLNRVAFSYQLEELSLLYGSEGIYRLWIGPTPAVIISKAHMAEPVLSSNTLISKSDLGYHFLRRWVGDGLLLSKGQKWRSRRKMLTPTFHFSILQSFLGIHNEQGRFLVEKLKPMQENRFSFDIFPFIGRCALDIICESAMGTSVGAQKDTNSEYVKAVVSQTELIFKRERMPWLWFKPIWYGLGYAALWNHNYDLLTGFTKKVIQDRKAALNKEAVEKGVKLSQLNPELSKKRVAFLDLLIMMQEEHNLTDEHIAEEVDVFMFEGHDTTSSGMGWSLFALGHHPEIQQKVYAELHGDSDRAATVDDLKQMEYLEMVIKGKYTVPKGSTVLILPFLLHRDEEQFRDAETFDPDRFLPENSKSRHAFSYIPFSAGPRNCIGQRFALMEEKTVLSHVIRNYEIKSLESKYDIRPIPDLILRPAEKFLVSIKPRNRGQL